MTSGLITRRNLLVTGTALLVSGASGLSVPAQAKGVAPTASMRGGSNNYRPGAPIVDRIGGGGFWMSGTVRRAGDGAPLAGQRIQIWAHTTEGNERDQRSHGATLTDAADGDSGAANASGISVDLGDVSAGTSHSITFDVIID